MQTGAEATAKERLKAMKGEPSGPPSPENQAKQRLKALKGEL